MRLHARGVPVVSVMMMGKLMPACISPRTRWSCGLMVEGIVACAATRASSWDVAETSRVRRLTALCVNRNTATTNTLPPTNSAVLSRVLPRDGVAAAWRIMRGLPPMALRGPRRTGSTTGPQHLQPAEPGPQRLRDDDGPVRLLMVLEQGRERARQRHARGVQRVRELDLGA